MPDDKHGIVLLSKLQAPQARAKDLFRDRLVDALRSNLDKKVILISAGAGYGKTTLLSQFLAKTKVRSIFYHLEKSDAEPVVFFSYLIEGIRKIEPEFGWKTEALSHFFNFPQRYMELIVGTFINEIIRYITDDIYIILEDYHALYPIEHINQIMDYLLEHMPPSMHFIITSRVTPPLSLSQLHAHNELYELQNQHLKFTKEETRTLCDDVYSMSLDDAELDWIEEHLEGWPTSLRLMLQSTSDADRKTTGHIHRILDSYYQSQSNLFNYFAQEIFNQETKATRQFLVDCSVFEWLSPELCDAVTRRSNSAKILSDLTDRNTFMFNMPGMGYRFHNLYRDFLQSKLKDKRKVKRLNVRAANYYLSKKRHEEAIKYFLQAEEYRKTAVFLETSAHDMIQQGRGNIFITFIEQIPRSIRMQRPALLMDYAKALIFGDRSDEARNHCQRAVTLFRKKPGAKAKFAEAMYNLGMLYLNQHKLKTAEKWFKKALAVCPSSSKLNRASILNAIGSTYTDVAGVFLPKGKSYFKRALRIAERNGFIGLQAAILNNWAINEFKTGNFTDAYPKLTRIVDLLAKGYSPGCGAGFFNAAHVSILLGHNEQAQAILDSGIEVCSSYSDVWSMARIWEGYAILYLKTREYDKAKQYIEKALLVNEKLGVVALIIRALNDLCRINLAAGDCAEAERNLSRIWVLKNTRTDADAVPLLLTEAELRIIQHRYVEAETALKSALSIAQTFKQAYNLFQIHCALSRVHHAQGQRELMNVTLQQAIRISRAKGYDHMLMQQMAQEQWMIQTVRRKGTETEKNYVMSIVKNSNLDIHWVNIEVFGSPRVTIDEHTIPDKAWPTLKSKKLVVFLMLKKHEKVTNDVLIDALWHDASSKSGGDNLRKALQHIRQACKANYLPDPGIILSGRGYYQVSPQVSLWIDAEEFRRLVEQAKIGKEKGEAYEDHLQQALTMYRGDFCTGWYDQWVEEYRHYYKGMYEECLAMVADLHLSKGALKEAIDYYEKLVEIDFFNEKYHRSLIKVHALLKRMDDVLSDYTRLQKRLKEELGVEPEEETTRVYKELTG
ncbi:tetratricopeptide repeat protein [candidate division WOR-3 bacterium]|nr:tetratricopeptide repeat protein [candidate division WOR-3 bacterium]